jgi:hypothetical protein
LNGKPNLETKEAVREALPDWGATLGARGKPTNRVECTTLMKSDQESGDGCPNLSGIAQNIGRKPGSPAIQARWLFRYTRPKIKRAGIRSSPDCDMGAIAAITSQVMDCQWVMSRRS